MSLELMTHLQDHFNGDNAITRLQFREYLNISPSTDWRIKKAGQYPKIINLAGSEKILLVDFAAWLNRGGATQEEQKKRGRPRGSRNKAKAVLNAPQ